MAVRKFKIENVKEICKNKNTKSFLHFINKKLGREHPKTIITDDTNNGKLDDDTAANLSAKFFYSTYSKDDGNEPIITVYSAIIPIINNFLNDDIAFNCDTIKIILKQLSNKFSSGPDAIPTFMIKMCCTLWL